MQVPAHGSGWPEARSWLGGSHKHPAALDGRVWNQGGCGVDVQRVVEVGLAESLAPQRPLPPAILAGLVGPHVDARRPQAQVEVGVLQRLLLVQAVWGDFRQLLSVVQLVAGRGMHFPAAPPHMGPCGHKVISRLLRATRPDQPRRVVARAVGAFPGPPLPDVAETALRIKLPQSGPFNALP